MKKRNLLTFLFILCLVASFLTACGGVDGPLGLGHRYGNPEVTYADGKVTIKYVCVDCDYYELEEREVVTQVSDAQSWGEAFGNLDESKYSLSIIGTSNGEVIAQKHFVISDNRGYYASVEPEELRSSGECYTLQKKDESFITYVISDEEGAYLADETDNRYWVQMKKESYLYFGLEDKFDQFTYDAESGSYISNEPMYVETFNFDGKSYGETNFLSMAVNIVDGNVCRINAQYTLRDEYLEEIKIDLCLYNIGYSVVKVPQHFIEAVTGKGDTTESGVFTYQLRDGKVTITGVNTAVGGELTIPAILDGYPVVAIGEGAFKDCVNVTSVVIPDSISTIGDNAFLGCAGLTNVKYGGTQAQWEAMTVGQTGNAPLLNATIQFSVACEHSYDDGVVTKEPTCGAMGIKTYTCSACGDAKIEYLAKHNSHSFNEGVVTEEPTCNEAGIKTYTCSVCGKNKTEYIPKLATHTYTNGTCTSCGADDPHYAVEEEEKEIGGIVGAFIQLFESIFKIFSFFK